MSADGGLDPPFGAYPPTASQQWLIRWFHSTPLGVNRARRWALKHFIGPDPRPVDAGLFGLKIRFHLKDNHQDGKAALCGASFNAAELRWLKAALPPSGRFVDLGANMGFFTFAAAAQGARVLAIEPNPTLFQRLEANVRSNALDRVTLLQAAVGDRQGQAALATGSDLGQGSIAERGNLPVRMELLHQVLTGAGWDRIDVLKIDIEGFEDRALLPFFSSAPASSYPRSILTEISSASDWRDDLLGRLKSLGYVRRARSRGNAWYQLRT